jgi:HEPN domain-containing protein
MTIELPAEIEARLKGEAQRQGVPAEQYAKQILVEHLGRPGATQSIEELFAEWEAEDHTDDPDEISRRNEEFEEFKKAMNQNRLDSEGPNARKLFP